jgi:hypothetical protein
MPWRKPANPSGKILGVQPALDALLARTVPEGGFSGRIGGRLRLDATAWAALVLALDSRAPAETLGAARGCLARQQRPDGSLAILPLHWMAVWPTAIAALAWHGSAVHQAARAAATGFLLTSGGEPLEDRGVYGHDTSLQGWSWTHSTHSWVEPTAISVIALRAAGLEAHPRVDEAQRLLMDRQLPSGGWNYGNTIVFGSELRPMPASTGIALSALAGWAPIAALEKSLDYVTSEIARLRTPFSLGWSLLGLQAWGYRPAGADSWIEEAWSGPTEHLPADTAELAILLLASLAPAGLLAALHRSAA